MKKTLISFAPLALAGLLHAQLPNPSGNWQLGSLELSFTELSGGGIDYSPDLLEEESLIFFANQFFSVGTNQGRWTFSDDRLIAITDGIASVAITENLDTLSFSDGDVNTQSGGNVDKVVNMNIAIKEVIDDFSVNSVSGTWNIIGHKTVSFANKGSSGSGFNAVIHAIDTLTLNSNGTFSLIPVSTTDPTDTEGGFSGTWSIVNRTIRLSVGTETLDIFNISRGLDTALLTTVEVFDNGSFCNTDNRWDLMLKEPATLSTADLVGKWGVAVLTIDVDDETEAFDQDFRGSVFTNANLELKTDGTGIFHPVNTSEPGASSDPENVTWSVAGKKLIVTLSSDGFTFSAFVSAEKDFASALTIDDGPGTATDAYDFITLCKLPDAPGFAAVDPNIVFSSSNPQVSIATDSGFFYQLQRFNPSSESFDNIGTALEGDGTTQSVTDTSAPIGGSLYRWALVPDPTP